MKEIQPRSFIDAVVRIPGSKSITHRAFIMAALAQGKSLIKDFLYCDDTFFTVNALRELGVEIFITGDDAAVSGMGGNFSPGAGKVKIFLGNSGTSFRLLLPVVALCRGEFLLTGTQRMLKRPVGPLVKALGQLGVEASCIQEKGFPPVQVKGKGIRGGEVFIEGHESSQFISSLLLAAPYAKNDIEIKVTGDLVSKPYVDITIDIIGRFGVHIDRIGYSNFSVLSGQEYQAGEFAIQGDVSSASYFWAAAAVTGGTVVTENIYPDATQQGDIHFLEILERMGCLVEKKPDRVVVHGGRLSGVDVDMNTMPDMVPTLAAVGLFAKGETAIRNVAHVRHKESDRLRCVAMEWSRLGGRVEELEDGLIVHGDERLSGTVVDPHNDHRLAMALAVVGLRIPGIRIEDETCVNKSCPQFWELWDKMK
jgi:3-phosphoshikimate 1-carboxyvinyltransferase